MTSQTAHAVAATRFDEDEVRGVIARYLDAVRRWDEAALRATFHPQANISHYYVKGDEIRTIDLDAFMKVIASLHARYSNAEEVAREIEVAFVGPLATVRVAFGFVMGEKVLEGQDIFVLAFCRDQWSITHKSYYL